METISTTRCGCVPTETFALLNVAIVIVQAWFDAVAKSTLDPQIVSDTVITCLSLCFQRQLTTADSS